MAFRGMRSDQWCVYGHGNSYMYVIDLPEFTQQQFADVLKLITVPSIWVGVLSFTWEVVAAMLGYVFFFF